MLYTCFFKWVFRNWIYIYIW